MARVLRIQFPGTFYHITCRGIERRHIFIDDKDRNRFLSLLSIYLLRRRLKEKMAENEAVSKKYKEIEAKVMNACSM